ncbi:hypothetical protein Tco_0332157 [Tanacetum coccineum]
MGSRVECFPSGRGKWGRVRWEEVRGCRKVYWRGGLGLKPWGKVVWVLAGTGPNKVMKWVLCVQWLRLAVTGPRIGPSKSFQQSLSIAPNGCCTVDWKSYKQSTTAMSAIEAEYIVAMEVVWIRKFISGLGISIALGEIKLLQVHIDDNLADPFTKALPNGKLTQHARSMGLRLASSFM